MNNSAISGSNQRGRGCYTSMCAIALIALIVLCSQFKTHHSPMPRIFAEPMIAHGGSFLRDGIPGLLAYYSDLKQFPTSEEGWRGLFVPPSDPDGKTLWKGPYLRRQDDAGDVITAAGFMASRPRSYESLDGGQAVHFTISRSGVDENAK